MCKIAQVASPKSNGKLASFIAIRWLTVQYCMITFSHAESDMSDFTAVLPVSFGSQSMLFTEKNFLANFLTRITEMERMPMEDSNLPTLHLN